MEDRFEIRDKRRLDQAGEIRDAQPKTDQSAAGQKAPEQPQQQKPLHHEEQAPHHKNSAAEGEAWPHEHGAEKSGASFMALVMNLAAMAYMAMGMGDVPSAPNLPEAMYIIDSLDILKEKTQGNLTPEEQKALQGIIYELKMNFSKVAP